MTDPVALATAIDALDYSAFRVLPEYIDANGHMNVGYYAVVFDRALDLPTNLLGAGWDMMNRTNRSSFSLESHLTFQREVMEGEPLTFTLQLIDWDEKRYHVFLTMRHGKDGWVAATAEQIVMCVDMTTRRAAAWPDDVQDRLRALHQIHRDRPKPAELGRVIGIRRKAA